MARMVDGSCYKNHIGKWPKAKKVLLRRIISSGHCTFHYTIARLATLKNNRILHQMDTIQSRFDKLVPSETSLKLHHAWSQLDAAATLKHQSFQDVLIRKVVSAKFQTPKVSLAKT